MAHDQHAKSCAHPQEDEPILVVGVIGIEVLDGVLILEDRLGFFERYLVLLDVRAVLSLVPHKPQAIHMYSVRMIDLGVKDVPLPYRMAGHGLLSSDVFARPACGSCRRHGKPADGFPTPPWTARAPPTGSTGSTTTGLSPRNGARQAMINSRGWVKN